ncbi:MAG: sulfite oxidase [SAR202 cluster bacterium]|nr:sulfite oxidase [SAR202 cluster bacterium]
MSLFVVKHRHTPESCPAKDRISGTFLLSHLSQATASQFGVKIRATAVLDGQHILELIVDASDEILVERFMAPFAKLGNVDIIPANTCETVVLRAQC